MVLLSDLLCENIGNVEYTTWVIVNYTQNLVNSINESPVQDFVMSVHRTASSSGLLLQGMFSSQFYIQVVNRPHFGTEILLFGLFGQSGQ